MNLNLEKYKTPNIGLRIEFEKQTGKNFRKDKDAYILFLEKEILRLEIENPTRCVGKEYP